MYHVVHVVKFLTRNLRLLGREAPNILLRALQVSGGTTFPSREITRVLGGDAGLVRLFEHQLADRELVELFASTMTGTFDGIEMHELLAILFGGDVPEVVKKAYQDHDLEQLVAVTDVLLAQRGVQLRLVQLIVYEDEVKN